MSPRRVGRCGSQFVERGIESRLTRQSRYKTFNIEAEHDRAARPTALAGSEGRCPRTPHNGSIQHPTKRFRGLVQAFNGLGRKKVGGLPKTRQSEVLVFLEPRS
jgi:hypothetical protein